jgi:hypothetical protein
VKGRVCKAKVFHEAALSFELRAVLGSPQRVDFDTLRPQSKERARMASLIGDKRGPLARTESP